MAKVITGTKAADTIKVWESGVTVNAGSGNDTIHLKKGTGSTIHGEAGDDTIYIHAGTHTVNGGAGDDVMVTWGNAGDASRFEGGNGNDSFKIKGGNNHVIITGDGSLNTVNLDKGSGHSITGGNTGVDRLFICSDDVTNITANLQNGENRATLWGGSDNTITGGNDTDIFNVKGGKNNKLYGGAGKDYLIIHTGEQNSIYGGDGDDRLTVWQKSGDKNNLYGEGGNDIIEVNGGNEHQIDGGDGYNQVKLKGGDRHTYTGGSGKDLVYISGGDGHTVNAGDGENRVTVYSGTGHVITGGKNTDIIDIKGGSNSEVAAGNGADYITISGGNGHKVDGGDGDDTIRVTGGESHQLYGGAGKDTFVYSEGNGNDIIYDYTEEDVLNIKQGLITKTELSNGDSDVVFTVGNGRITLKNAAQKGISIVDSNGSYKVWGDTALGNAISLGADYQGTMDANSFFSTVSYINARNTTQAVNVRGNAQDNDIRASSYGGSYWGGAGDDSILGNSSEKLWLYGDEGNDQLTGGANDDELYGGEGNDYLRGSDGNDKLYGGVGNDKLYGGSGNNDLYGGAGNDIFGFSNVSNGNSVVYDYSEEDSIEIGRNAFTKTEIINNNKDLRFALSKGGSVTLKNAKNKKINIHDYFYGNFVISETEIIMASNFKGVMDSGAFLATVKKIDGSLASESLTIGGNVQDNLIYGGSGDDIIYGLDGNDTINGMSGNDALYGGAGKDIFVYAQDEGNDVIYDYEEGEDTLQINNGTAYGKIIKTEITNNEKDLVFTVDKGSVTLKDAVGKIISIKDYRGSYTVSGNEVNLKEDFSGEIDASGFLSTLRWIRASQTKNGVTIKGKEKDEVIYGGSGNDVLYGLAGDDFLIGNAGSDTIYGGDGADALVGGAGNDFLYGGNGNDGLQGNEGNDYLAGQYGNNTLNGGKGDDQLVGGSGNDTFQYANGDGNDTIFNYNSSGNDILEITGTTIAKASLVNGSNVVFTIGSGKVTINSAATKTINIKDSRGSYTASNNTIKLGTDFKGTMFASNYLDTVITIDGRNAKQKITICGNGQDNTIYAASISGGSCMGGDGNDRIYGGSELDYIEGEAGNDSIYGGGGDDYLWGCAGNDYLYGESGNDRLDGGDGNDYLDGGAGNDKLTGGDGKDTFAFATGSGDDTINDYTEGQDTLKILVGTIGKTELANGGKDLVFTVGDGKVTLEEAAAKTIRIDGTKGSYTASDKKIILGSDYQGSINANNYLSTVITIDAGAAKQAVTVTGNAQDNYIWVSSAGGTYRGGDGSDYIVGGGTSNVSLYGDAGDDTLYSDKGDDYVSGGTGDDDLHGGAGNDTLYGGADNDTLYGETGDDTLYGETGDDTLKGGAGDDVLRGGSGNDALYGGTGSDVFWYDGGNDTIYDYEVGTDIIRLSSADIWTGDIVGKDVKLTLSNGNTITVKNVAEETIDFIDTNGTKKSVTPVTQQGVIKKFMKLLDNTDKIVNSVVSALNDAVNYASGGYYKTWDSLINNFVSDVKSNGGGSYAFLYNYCGIDLYNTDTGSITGWDAGGVQTKTAESVVPETGTIYSLQAPPYTTTTINGLTFHWPTVYNNSAERQIINSIYTWWAKEGLNLIEESYGLSFKEAGKTVSDINVEFYYEDTNTLARVWHWWHNNGETYQLSLQINNKFSNEIDLTDINGYAGNSAGYFDRIIAHELTHAVMSANITGFMSLPKCIIEGAAELVHGIDDFRTSDLTRLEQSSNVNDLITALNDYSDNPVNDVYAGGYMLLRYLAKQVSNSSYFPILSSNASSLASSMSDGLSSAMTLASYEWADNAIGTADTENSPGYFSGEASMALFSSFDTAGSSFVTDSSMGLFTNYKKDSNFYQHHF